MDGRNAPPWRRGGGRESSSRPMPQSTIPAKRSADSSRDAPSKRTLNAQEDAWVADEDRFVLQQAKKKAAIRVKAGRARPIDWLAVTLRFIDPTKTLLDEEIEDQELDVVDPEGVFEGLSEKELSDLQKDIEDFLALEMNRENRDYWKTMKVICKDRRRRFKPSATEARGISTVQADIDKLLAPKTYQELEKLEGQINNKLNTDSNIDVDYWESLLKNLLVWKAKAKLRKITQTIVDERLQAFRRQQADEALAVESKVRAALSGASGSEEVKVSPVAYDPALDPRPMLKLRPEYKALKSTDEKKFLEAINDERRKVQKLGYVPAPLKAPDALSNQHMLKEKEPAFAGNTRFAAIANDDPSQATTALYEREAARGVNEDEEIFAAEEDVSLGKAPKWADQHKPRKPRYFNRVQMGYEWNKYNQTHYDHDNPPPKVVQGYKFNIFYPELIDKTKAPTFRVERENGRKKGQSFAPAGEDDTCLIRFSAGPPYEDIAFRIVDKEWDYSAKRERGFRSTFDKGILQLHFQFKKVYYRK